MRNHRRASLLALLLFFLLSACAPHKHAVRIIPIPQAQAQGISADDQRRLDENCPFGQPKTQPDWPFGLTRMVYRDGYVLQHSSTDKIPVWVCEAILPEHLSDSPLTRSNPFAPDPSLPVGERAELKDYKGSGYDRGHMAPAGDQEVDERLKDETFFLSNMSPQEGALNQQSWAALEKIVRDWSRIGEATEVHAITGGFFHADNEASHPVEYFVIGDDSVAVPTHFFKVVTGKDRQGHLHVLAFVMENRKYPKPWHFGQYLRDLDWLEAHTGLKLLPTLDPDDARTALKTCFVAVDCQ